MELWTKKYQQYAFYGYSDQKQMASTLFKENLSDYTYDDFEEKGIWEVIWRAHDVENMRSGREDLYVYKSFLEAQKNNLWIKSKHVHEALQELILAIDEYILWENRFMEGFYDSDDDPEMHQRVLTVEEISQKNNKIEMKQKAPVFVRYNTLKSVLREYSYSQLELEEFNSLIKHADRCFILAVVACVVAGATLIWG